MDEEIRYEKKYDDCFLCHHPVLKHVLTALMVFLGAYCAFYVVSDWHYKQMYDPAYQMRKMDRMMINQERNMEHAFKKYMRNDMRLEHKANQIVHLEKNPDAYKIIIDLKPFDNDEKNVEVRVNGDTLTINAAGIKEKRHKESIYKFSQSYTFDDDADLSKMDKTKVGDSLIITIPIEN